MNENIIYRRSIIGGSKIGVPIYMLEITGSKTAKQYTRIRDRKVIII